VSRNQAIFWKAAESADLRGAFIAGWRVPEQNQLAQALAATDASLPKCDSLAQGDPLPDNVLGKARDARDEVKAALASSVSRE
jgi:hypothetical protein